MTTKHVGRPLTATVLAAVVATACAHDAPAPTHLLSQPPDIAQFVTGTAAAALTTNGTFPDAEPAARERPMISRERAGVLALAYVRSYGQFLKASWDKERGAAIRLSGLSVAPRVYFAESPYGAFPEGPYHPAFRRSFGPFHVVTLAEGSTPVLLVAVSAFNTDVQVDERGDVHDTPLGGAEFMSVAIPVSGSEYRFLSPEEAVERAARGTGARAKAVPELLLRGRYHPSLAVWRVPLDRPVRVRGVNSATRRSVETIYVDGNGQSLVPAAEQPDAEILDLPIGPPWEREVRRTMPARIPVAPHRAVQYEVVVAEPGA